MLLHNVAIILTDISRYAVLLLLQKVVYDYLLDYEMTIIGYYTNRDGHDLMNKSMHVLGNVGVYGSIQHNVLSNYKFYTWILDQHALDRPPASAAVAVAETCSNDNDHSCGAKPGVQAESGAGIESDAKASVVTSQILSELQQHLLRSATVGGGTVGGGGSTNALEQTQQILPRLTPCNNPVTYPSVNSSTVHL